MNKGVIGMTKEEGVVIKTDTATAWIKTIKTSACASCSAKSSCHTMGGGKEMEVEAINTAGARIGDRVVIGFETASLLKASFLLYVFPILGLILGAFIGQTAAPLLNHPDKWRETRPPSHDSGRVAASYTAMRPLVLRLFFLLYDYPRGPEC